MQPRHRVHRCARVVRTLHTLALLDPHRPLQLALDEKRRRARRHVAPDDRDGPQHHRRHVPSLRLHDGGHRQVAPGVGLDVQGRQGENRRQHRLHETRGQRSHRPGIRLFLRTDLAVRASAPLHGQRHGGETAEHEIRRLRRRTVQNQGRHRPQRLERRRHAAPPGGQDARLPRRQQKFRQAVLPLHGADGSPHSAFPEQGVQRKIQDRRLRRPGDDDRRHRGQGQPKAEGDRQVRRHDRHVRRRQRLRRLHQHGQNKPERTLSVLYLPGLQVARLGRRPPHPLHPVVGRPVRTRDRQFARLADRSVRHVRRHARLSDGRRRGRRQFQLLADTRRLGQLRPDRFDRHVGSRLFHLPDAAVQTDIQRGKRLRR